MGGMAQGAVGLNRLPVGVRVPNLHNAGNGNKCTAKEAERHPQRMTRSRIEATPWHKSLHGSCVFECDVALGESNVHRRRPGEERKHGKVLGKNRLKSSRYRLHHPDRMRQRLRNGWLNDYVGSMAKRTIGLNRLTVSVRMRNLYDPGKNNQRAAEEAKRYP